jgi:hypothetical protein
MEPSLFTLITASYCTPQTTLRMLKSFVKINGNGPWNILLYENSPENDVETVKLLTEQQIPYIRNPSGLHGYTINRAFQECKTKYVLVVDTDIVFKKPMDNLFEIMKKGFVALGNISGPRGGKNIMARLDPWFCLYDVETIRKHNITYYEKPICKDIKNAAIYDVGSSFLECVSKNNLRVASMQDIGNFFTHYEGMSWRIQKFSNTDPIGDIDIDPEAKHDSVILYNLGEKCKVKYLEETKELDVVDIKPGTFIQL